MSLVSDRAGGKTNIVKSVLCETMSESVLTQNRQSLHIFKDRHIHQISNNIYKTFQAMKMSVVMRNNVLNLRNLRLLRAWT